MEVQVRQGQTVSGLAVKYHTTVRAIADANQLPDANRVRAGQTLQIPVDSATVSADALAKPRPHRGGHVVVTPRPEKLKAATGPSPAKPITHKSRLSKQDVDALVRAVAAEARGESPAVWTAVAQTIINYARKSGQSISNVTRSSYLSSNYDGNRVFYHLPMVVIPHHDAIRQAVLKAGDGASPIGKRNHFHDVSIATPSWGHASTRIGHMVFYSA